MKIRIGLFISFFIILLQWLVVSSFVEHSYMWWEKASDPTITAGYAGTILLSIISLLATGYALWAHDKLYAQKSRMKYVAQLVAMAGLSGLLVFFGMVFFGYLLVVYR